MNALKMYGESLGVLEKVSVEIIHEAIDELLEKKWRANGLVWHIQECYWISNIYIGKSAGFVS